MKSQTTISAILLCVLLAGRAIPQETEPAADAVEGKSVEEQIAALIEKQNALADQYNAIVRRIKQNEELQALDKDIAAAEKQLAEAEAADEDLLAARRAEEKAASEAKKAVEEMIAEHPEGGKLQAQLETLREQRDELRWQVELARFQIDHPLSPVGRALKGDADLAELKRRANAAPRSERAEAMATLLKRRHEKAAELPQGRELVTQVEQATAALEKLQQTIVAVEQRLSPIREKIEADQQGALEKARQAVADARQSGRLKELADARTKAIKEYNAKVKQLIAADPDAAGLRAEYEALGRQVRQLRQKKK